jgi:hypothetical protein
VYKTNLFFFWVLSVSDLDLFAVFIAEVGEGIELIQDATNCFGFGEFASAGDGDDTSFLGGMDRLSIRALPGAVVDFVGGSETVVVLSVGFGDFDAGHIFERFRGFESGFALVWSIG